MNPLQNFLPFLWQKNSYKLTSKNIQGSRLRRCTPQHRQQPARWFRARVMREAHLGSSNCYLFCFFASSRCFFNGQKVKVENGAPKMQIMWGSPATGQQNQAQVFFLSPRRTGDAGVLRNLGRPCDRLSFPCRRLSQLHKLRRCSHRWRVLCLRGHLMGTKLNINFFPDILSHILTAYRWGHLEDVLETLQQPWEATKYTSYNRE